MINPAHDVWVWSAAVLFLLLMGARAYAVETGQVRLGRTPTTARVLTAAVVLVVVALGGLLTMQGGKVLFNSILHHTDPSQIPNLVLDPNAPQTNPAQTNPAQTNPAQTDPAQNNPAGQQPVVPAPAGQAPAAN